MRVNLDWLRDWVDIGSDATRAAADLTTAGLEVDSVEPAAVVFEGIVVGHVQEVARHPNADRLSVCVVDDGTAQHQVVCGAANVRSGIKVPFARVGAVLPGGKSIGAAELRGVKSHGMLCSGKELGLPEEANGLLILDGDAPVGTSLREHLRLDDHVLEINVTPNRGDCFSVIGLARELAARRGQPLLDRAISIEPTTADTFPIALSAGPRCARFVSRVVRGLSTTARTPLWMRERLRRAGLRPIQPVVDVTNYVMIELGQPLHAYDLAKLEHGIDVRLARPKEPLVLLDGRAVELDDDMLVIADGQGPVGLAGIMGGKRSAVSEATGAVLLESAFFAPGAIAGRARRLGMHTDASLRFERGVDPAGQRRAIERATELLLAICGGSAGPVTLVEDPGDLPRRREVPLRREKLRKILGLDVAAERVEMLLTALGLRVETAADGWLVTPPSFRFDIAIEEDLIEEIGRMIGYDHIPVTPGTSTANLGRATEAVIASDRLADVLVARGYAETITYSFIDPAAELAVNPGTEPIALANPIASDLAVLRRSLWPGLINVARLNLSYQRQRMKLFELGPQFLAAGDGVTQTMVLAGLALGSRTGEHWGGQATDLDFFDVKGDVEALLRLSGKPITSFAFEAAEHPALCPGRTARITFDGQTIGWLGTLHPDLQARLDKRRTAVLFALQVDAAFQAQVPTFRAYSKFPSIRRDLAILVEESTTAEAIARVARSAAGERLQDVIVFDVYRGKGIDSSRKSIGLGLILQDVSRTLTDEDADQTTRSIMLRLEHEFGATIRT